VKTLSNWWSETFSTDVRTRYAISWYPGCSDDEIEWLSAGHMTSKSPVFGVFNYDNLCVSVRI
jgi:hypothetical protein